MKKLLRYGYRFDNKEDIILRDYLALERTRLANERTFISYIRTALFFVTGGITLLQLEGIRHLDWLGYVAIGSSIVLLLIGVIRFLRLAERLDRYYQQIKPSVQEEAQG